MALNLFNKCPRHSQHKLNMGDLKEKPHTHTFTNDKEVIIPFKNKLISLVNA